MAKIDGATIVARMLKEAGVERIFTLSGGHIFRIFQECEKVGIQILDVRSEGAGVYAAMGYAQASGKMGVFVATAGPGVTNTVTAVADSHIFDVPLLIIGGGSAEKQLNTETLQEYDTVSMMAACTGWSKRCTRTERIGEYMATAIRACLGMSPGSAYVEFPIDILEAIYIEEDLPKYPVNYMYNRRSGADPAAVEEIADLLIHAERPAMLIGEGAQYGCGNMSIFAELAEYLQLPTGVSRTNKGKCGREEKTLYRVGQLAAASADVVLALNIKLDFSENTAVNPNARLISIHTNSQWIGLNRPVDIGICAHSDVVAAQILECVKAKTPKKESSTWVDLLKEKHEATLKGLDAAYFLADTNPIHPARVAHEVQIFLNEDGGEFCQVVDGGDCLLWELVAANYKMRDIGAFPNRFFYSTKLGTIGYGLGAAFGVWAATGRPVLLTLGDGSFGEYIGELYTYVKHGAQIVVLICNDSNFGMIKGFAIAHAPEENVEIANTLSPGGGSGYFAYDKITASWGGHGETVADAAEIVPALIRAKESGGVSVLNVIADCKEEFFNPGTVGLYKRLLL